MVVTSGTGAGGGLTVETVRPVPVLPSTPPVGFVANGLGLAGSTLGAGTSVGVLTASGDGVDVGLGLSGVAVATDGAELWLVATGEVCGATPAPWPVLLGGAAAAPTVMRTMAAASAAPPAALLPSLAHPTLPLARAISATTRANIPTEIAAPLSPKASPPMRTTRARPPQPNKSATPGLWRSGVVSRPVSEVSGVSVVGAVALFRWVGGLAGVAVARFGVDMGKAVVGVGAPGS